MLGLITRAMPESGSGHPKPGHASGDRFGLCPHFRGFVRIGPSTDPATDEACPEYRGMIRELDGF